MSTTTDDATRRRWRRNLGAALVVMVLIAAASTVGAFAYGEAGATPLFLWAGTGCVVVAWRRVGTTSSAVWVLLGILVFFAGPLALG